VEQSLWARFGDMVGIGQCSSFFRNVPYRCAKWNIIKCLDSLGFFVGVD
jgi:hypothetical protein